MPHMNTHDEAWTAVQMRMERTMNRPRLGDALAKLDGLVPPAPMRRVLPAFACRIEPATRAA